MMELDLEGGAYGKEPAKKKPAGSPKDDAASDVLAAIKAGDAAALNLALTRHYEACAAGGDEDDEEEV